MRQGSVGCVSAGLHVRLGGPEREVQLTAWIKLVKDMFLEWSFFLRLSMALCPKSCTEDSIFQFNPPIVVLSLVCFSVGASPVSLVSQKCILCAGMMPLAVVLSRCLLKGCAFVTDRACLHVLPSGFNLSELAFEFPS